MGVKPAVVLLLSIASCAGIVGASDIPAGWQTQENHDYGFALAYPKSFRYYSGGLDYKDITLSSFIPVCELSTVACFIYKGNEYKGTNFEGAGVSVNILRDKRTEKDCNQIDSGPNKTGEETINGIHFHYGGTAGVATGHWEASTLYRALHDNVCFEVTSATSGFFAEVTDPPTKTFDSQKLDKDLGAIIQSFRFVGPVVDGPAWKLYNDSDCGGTFELPDSDEMVTDTENSNEKYFSREISCSIHFEDHGRKYSLSAKVNLQSQDGLEAWLKSSGYPDLKGEEGVGKSQYFMEYKAGSYYYVFGQGALYILSLSDASGHILNPDGDRIFNHLLRSFKCQ